MTDDIFSQAVTFLYTCDLAATAQFYAEVLGLPLVRDQGDCLIYRVAAGGYIGFCQRAAAPQEPPGIILTLVSDDVDGWHERLRGRDVPIVKPPTANPQYGIYHCFFRDPNGYLLEIQRFDDPLS